MKRRVFLAMAIPAVATACVGLGGGIATPSPTERLQPGESEAGVRRRTGFGRGENLRNFMKRARDRRNRAAKKRRERLARARRRRRNRGR